LELYLEGPGRLLSTGAPDCPVAHRTAPVQRLLNRLIGHLPFWVGTGQSGGTLNMSGNPPDRCRANVASNDLAMDRW
jgi:hypothetical protein